MAVLAAYQRLASNPAIARLLGGEFLAAVGDWVYLLALLVLVYAEGNSPLLLGLVGAGRILPYVLLSVPAGYLADKVDRRTLLLVADSARCALMVAVTVLVATGAPLFLVVALTLAAASCSALVGPVVGAYLPSLVDDESQLGPANSAWATLDDVAFTLGPAVGGILIAILPLPVTFALTAALFGLVTITIRGIPRGIARAAAAPTAAGSDSPAEEPAAAPGFFSSGLVVPLVGLVLVEIVFSFVSGGLGVLTVVLAIDLLQAGEGATGALNAGLGIGGLVGAVASGAFILRSLAVPFVAGAMMMAAGTAALAFASSVPVALVAFALAALGNLFADVILMTILQRTVPDALLGRAVGLILTVWAAFYALGALAYPLLVAAAGALTLLGASALAVAVVAAIGLVLFGESARIRLADPLGAVGRFLGIPALAGVSQTKLEAAARRAQPIAVPQGTVVVRQGDPADRFYFIDVGRFQVTQAVPGEAAERDLRTLGPGGGFGEIGLLAKVPRTASVTALTDGRLLALDGADFLELVGPGPGQSSRLLDFHRGALGRR